MTTPRAGGLASTGAVFSAPPQPGAVRAVGNGGSYSFYSIGHDETIGRKMADFLQTTDYARG